MLTPPPSPLAPGLFDYRTYLARQSIYYQLKADSARDWKPLDANTNRPYAERFLGWAQRTLARGLPEQDEPLRLLWAMTLGWKTDESSQADDGALVRQGEFYGVKILLLSDLGRAGQNILLDRETNNLRADIVVAGFAKRCLTPSVHA